MVTVFYSKIRILEMLKCILFRSGLQLKSLAFQMFSSSSGFYGGAGGGASMKSMSTTTNYVNGKKITTKRYLLNQSHILFKMIRWYSEYWMPKSQIHLNAGLSRVQNLKSKSVLKFRLEMPFWVDYPAVVAWW